MEEGRHPRQLIGQQGFVRLPKSITDILIVLSRGQGNKVPSIVEAGAAEVYGIIAERLFGDDAFRDPNVPRPIVKDELNKFVSTCVVHIWNKMRKRVADQYERLNKGKADANAEFESAYLCSQSISLI
jgi:hypothetical protein